MYTSKYFTCEQIDQRLLQGYFDDAVKAGFVGILADFWAMILSIKDKAGSEDVKKKLEELTKELKQQISNSRVLKVSELENDLKYQTEEQVKGYISKLVNGADEALDTLLELAEALGNDPHFAATITEKLGQLQKQITGNAEATEKEFEKLSQALKEEIAKREEGDKENLNHLQQAVTSINQTLQNTYNNLDLKIQAINKNITDLTQNFGDFKESVTKDINGIKDTLATDFDAKIKEEADRASKRENAIEENCNTKTSELDRRVSQNTSDIQTEENTRETEDTKLRSEITQEAAERIREDANLQSKISDESLARIQGDTDLQTSISQEASERQAADSALASDLNTEKNERSRAVENLQNQLNNATLKHENDLDNLRQEIESDHSRIDIELEGKVDSVAGKGLSTNDFTNELLEKLNSIDAQANRVTKVSELLNDLNFVNLDQVNEEIQKIIGTAPGVLDTLGEIAEALGNDPNFATSILNKLSTLATQLNEEVEKREQADAALKLELLTKIKETTTELKASYQVLEERLNSYKSNCDSQYNSLKGEVTNLNTKLDEKVTFFLQKVTELSDSYSEKVTSLNERVNNFAQTIFQRVNAQDELINQNTSNIQKNFGLIQALHESFNKFRETYTQDNGNLFDQITQEANARELADKALEKRLDANDEALEDLENQVKNNTNLKGSTSIDITKVPQGETTSILVEAIVREIDPLLSIGLNGIQSEIGLKRSEDTPEKIVYQITGKGGTLIPGMEFEVPKRMGDDFTEQDAEEMFNQIYGEPQFN